MIASDTLGRIRGVRHGFFTRQGGVSDGIYASLNTGYGSSDDAGRVAENRRRIASRMGADEDKLLSLWQSHSPDVATATQPWDVRRPPDADGAVTSTPGLAIAIQTADCTPVLFASADGAVVGGAHAGWKGAIGGVLEATVAAMRDLGGSDIHAAIGPTISQANYEVGAEFRAAFLAEHARNSRFFTPSQRAGHFMFDLPGYVRSRLARLELAGIEDTGLCTYADEARFFSYRRTTHRGEPDYGRQMSVIMVTG